MEAGTTLEILAPYLPYGIELETGIDNGLRGRKALHSLTKDGYLEVYNIYGGVQATLFTDVLPVLRPFAQLVEPLPDGTVPAVELAKQLFDDMVGEGGEISAGFDHFGNVVVTDGPVCVMCIYPSWLIRVEEGLFAGPAEYDYLRRKHFAVGLQPHQFIEKK